MRTEKRIYVKPYTTVLNVQTEGVIAASAIISENDLCRSNSILSASAGDCHKDNNDPIFISNCGNNNPIGTKNHSCLKYMYQNVEMGKVTLYNLGNGNIKIVSGWE